MFFDRVDIFLVRVRQGAEQFHEFASGKGVVTHRDDLTDRFTASFHDESLVAISHAIQDF